MIQATYKKPDFKRGILWGIFSATATITAFLFPLHLMAIAAHARPFDTDNFPVILYFVMVYFSALYHGLYRLKTVLKDLKILK